MCTEFGDPRSCCCCCCCCYCCCCHCCLQIQEAPTRVASPSPTGAMSTSAAMLPAISFAVFLPKLSLGMHMTVVKNAHLRSDTMCSSFLFVVKFLAVVRH
ncbi:unnamed protein product [Polarella glacialis]|uniref:Uncharacterized protein n=1 Tax=Polarella glacialis TaxID=89957 RepID=A0A813DGW2_POLGL|nr:unnamed protein product [Polarella glacialis]